MTLVVYVFQTWRKTTREGSTLKFSVVLLGVVKVSSCVFKMAPENGVLFDLVLFCIGNPRPNKWGT